MKRFQLIASRLFLVAGLAVAAAGCDREEFFSTDDSEFARKQVVKFMVEDEVTVISRDLNPTTEQFALIELRRTPNSEAELNQPLTVTIGMDNALIPTGFDPLPADAY